MKTCSSVLLSALALSLSGCSEKPGDTGHVDDTGEAAAPEPAVAAFGFEETRQLVLVGDRSDALETPRDLAFHPERDELWVQNRYGATSPYEGGSHVIWFNPEGEDRYPEDGEDGDGSERQGPEHGFFRDL